MSSIGPKMNFLFYDESSVKTLGHLKESGPRYTFKLILFLALCHMPKIHQYFKLFMFGPLYSCIVIVFFVFLFFLFWVSNLFFPWTFWFEIIYTPISIWTGPFSQLLPSLNPKTSLHYFTRLDLPFPRFHVLFTLLVLI